VLAPRLAELFINAGPVFGKDGLVSVTSLSTRALVRSISWLAVAAEYDICQTRINFTKVLQMVKQAKDKDERKNRVAGGLDFSEVQPELARIHQETAVKMSRDRNRLVFAILAIPSTASFILMAAASYLALFTPADKSTVIAFLLIGFLTLLFAVLLATILQQRANLAMKTPDIGRSPTKAFLDRLNSTN